MRRATQRSGNQELVCMATDQRGQETYDGDADGDGTQDQRVCTCPSRR